MALRIITALVVLLMILPGQLAGSVQAQTPLDYDLPVAGGARFFTQTDGQSGASGTGYAVSNAEGVPFYSFFQQVGGVPAVGYPVSHRFRWDGYVVQAFQKVVFQWRPEAGTVYYVNVLDELHDAGFDPYLRTVRQVPLQANWASDASLPFPQVVARHLALLDASPAIAAAYYREPDTINRNGLPMAPIEEFSGVRVLRAQRKVFQEWLVPVPWARQGEVTVANGGDLAKEVGYYPPASVTPRPASAVPLNVVADLGAPPPPAGACNGDEEISFFPGNPTRFQQVEVQVTSARPSVNVALTGAWSPQFQGVRGGGKGTIWVWTFTPTSDGSYEYRFSVEGATCTTRTVFVSGNPSVPAGCNGDEEISFLPGNPAPRQQVEVQVTSARPSVNVGLDGPWSPEFRGARGGGKGTIWVWTFTPDSGGTYEYRFTVEGTTCASRSVTVSGGPIVPAECEGDEEISFRPAPAVINELVTVEVTSSEPSVNVGLTGPWNPVFEGARGGGKGTIWTWRIRPGEPGRFTYNFTVEGRVCTSAALDVRLGR